METHWTDGEREVRQGDAWSLADALAPASADCLVTSPPYWGLRDYGVEGQFGLEKHPQEWIDKLVDLFVRLRPALKRTATMWVNLGDTYGASGSTTPESQDSSRYAAKSGLSGRYTEGQCKRPVTPRHRGDPWVRPKQLLLLPERFAIAMCDAGFLLRNKITWAKPNAMPSSAQDRFTTKTEVVYFFTVAERYYFDLESIRVPAAGNGAEAPSERVITLSASVADELLAASEARESAAGFAVCRLAKAGEGGAALAASPDLASAAGWGNSIGPQAPIGLSMAWDAEHLQVPGGVRLFMVGRCPKGLLVMYLEDGFLLGDPASLTSVVRSHEFARDNHRTPVGATVSDTSACPSGAVGTDTLPAAPFSVTGLVAEVVGLDRGAVSLHRLPAVVALYLERPDAQALPGAPPLRVAGTVHALIVPEGTSHVKSGGANPGDFWVIPTHAFPAAHFATFSPKLIERPLKAGCPREVCVECGNPKVREVAVSYGPKPGWGAGSANARRRDLDDDAVQAWDPKPRLQREAETVAWKPTCDCGAGFEPGLVLDPFLGSGTTLCVAKELGLRGIGFELSEDYCRMAEKRIADWKRPKEHVAAEKAGQGTLFDAAH